MTRPTAPAAPHPPEEHAQGGDEAARRRDPHGVGDVPADRARRGAHDPAAMPTSDRHKTETAGHRTGPITAPSEETNPPPEPAPPPAPGADQDPAGTPHADGQAEERTRTGPITAPGDKGAATKPDRGTGRKP